MTPDQEREIKRLEARGRVIHMDRAGLPLEARKDFDENIPKSLPVIIKHGRSRHHDLYWYKDWVYQT